MRRVAVAGSGIAGLAAADALVGEAQVTLFEAGSCFGGRTHTADVTLPGPGGPVTDGVDTGFLVFNHRTCPNLVLRFIETLTIKPSERRSSSTGSWLICGASMADAAGQDA